MDWPEVRGEIESQEFAVRVNVASSRRVFLAALKAEPAFVRLTELLRETPALATRVLRRIAALAALEFDFRYEHPYDAALAAYAWALAAETPESARMAAELLIGTVQTYWAQEMARLILEVVPASTTDCQTQNLTSTEPRFEWRQPRAAMASGDVFESRIIWAILLLRPELECLVEIHSKMADVPSEYTDPLTWPYQAGIWDELGRNLVYNIRLPYPAETTAEWGDRWLSISGQSCAPRPR